MDLPASLQLIILFSSGHWSILACHVNKSSIPSKSLRYNSLADSGESGSSRLSSAIRMVASWANEGRQSGMGEQEQRSSATLMSLLSKACLQSLVCCDTKEGRKNRLSGLPAGESGLVDGLMRCTFQCIATLCSSARITGM